LLGKIACRHDERQRTIDLAILSTPLPTRRSRGLGCPLWVVLPSWVWWLVICATLFTAARIQIELDSQKAGKKTPSVTLAQLVERIVGSNDVYTDSVHAKIGKALIEIRQQAVLGSLSTWGQKGGNRNDYDPLEQIPKEHWVNAHIDYMQYLQDKRCATTNARLPGSPDQYSNLQFDASEVGAIWPVSGRKIRFRLPFVWD